jgi:hypothetical protein
VAKSLAPGAMVAEVARRAEVCPAQIYTLAAGTAGVGERLRPDADCAEGSDAATDGSMACAAEPAIEVEFAGKARVRIPGSAGRCRSGGRPSRHRRSAGKAGPIQVRVLNIYRPLSRMAGGGFAGQRCTLPTTPPPLPPHHRSVITGGWQGRPGE